jgi:hypothetical protein
MKQAEKVSHALECHLSAYALVASAAGVGVIALAQPVEARIVYTKTHMDCNTGCSFDLAGHQFTLQWFAGNSGSSGNGSSLAAIVQSSRELGVVGYMRQDGSRSSAFASALRAGVKIGRQKHMAGVGRMWGFFFNNINKKTYTSGAWANGGKGEKDHYLGLVFNLAKGKSYANYGWARLTVSRYGGPYFSTTLTGYAYETMPGKPIIAGKTKGRDVMTVEPGSLGHLAGGTAARRAKENK